MTPASAGQTDSIHDESWWYMQSKHYSTVTAVTAAYDSIWHTVYGGWSKHSCRCVIRNDLAPALALPCALQGFYCVPLHRLKYVFKNWLPQKVAQFKGVFTDPVRCATQTFLAFGSKIWWFGARILRSWRFWGALPTEEIWFPKRPFRARKQLYGNQISRGMVEGECIHIGIWFPNGAFEPESSFTGIKFQEVL